MNDALDGFIHIPVYGFILATVHARSIHKNHLCIRQGFYSQQPVARCLRLAGSDAELLTHKEIQQGRFANIGLANNSDKTTTGCGSLGLIGVVRIHAGIITGLTGELAAIQLLQAQCFKNGFCGFLLRITPCGAITGD